MGFVLALLLGTIVSASLTLAAHQAEAEKHGGNHAEPHDATKVEAEGAHGTHADKKAEH